MKQSNFEQYEMYNDLAERVELFYRATFVRLHNSEEAKNFVLDLYRHYHDEEVHFDGIDIDSDEPELRQEFIDEMLEIEKEKSTPLTSFEDLFGEE